MPQWRDPKKEAKKSQAEVRKRAQLDSFDKIDQEIEGGNRIPMTLIEANNTARTEYNQCVNRQQKLLNDLKVKRSDRLSKQVKDNASILNLVQLWREEESRDKMIHLAELRKQSLKAEITKLTSMDEIKDFMSD